MPTLLDSQLRTLSTTNDFFKEKTFLELIDKKKLYALVISKNVCMTTKKWWEDRNMLLQPGELPNEQNFLKLVYRNLIKRNNKYYIKTSYFSRLTYGRVYPTKIISQGIIRRQIRHFLCKDLYYDIDIVNAHRQSSLCLPPVTWLQRPRIRQTLCF